MKFGLTLLVCLLAVFQLDAQSYRGLAVVNDSTACVSGSKGTVIRTVNGGQTWDTISPPGYAKKEFRDIHADDSLIIVMSSGDSAVILRSADFGKTWTEVFRQDDTLIFLDALDMYGSFGAVVGDPFPDENGILRFEFLVTRNGGRTWQRDREIRNHELNRPVNGEAVYAASGSNLNYRKAIFQGVGAGQSYSFMSGGMSNNLYYNGAKYAIPCNPCATCGMYGMTQSIAGKLFVGGNYLRPNDTAQTSYYFDYKLNKVKPAQKMPSGYRSGVASSSDNKVSICTGTNGSDISFDGGINWQPINLPGMNTVQFSPNFLWMAGNKGQVLRVAYKDLKSK
ncbi:MAG: hypothetical protein EP332_03935 [Bacteroidetes bacterium]|nr:MAG: hypothetical protein EP332_03935 [Bacteroidota bacterium]